MHGVHGTSPAAMLGVADGEVGQVAGDRLTGVYRVTSGRLPYRLGRQHPGPPVREQVSVEAYSWGALTSGVQGALGWVQRVLWLLLLPFALVNLAYWARLDVGRVDRRSGDVWSARAVRLTGLMLTVFLALSASVIAVDVVGWQCYRDGAPGCSLPGPVDQLGRLDASGRMAATSVLAMLVIGVLWWLSRTSLARYEDTPDPTRDQQPPALEPTGSGRHLPVLRHPHLWNGRQRTERLQRLHVATGLATVVAFTDLHLSVAAEGSAAVLLALTGAAFLVLVVAAVLVSVSHPDDIEHAGPVQAWQRGSGGLALVALGLCLVHVLVLALWPLDGYEQGRDLVGHNVWFIVVFVLMTALSLAVFTGGRMSAAGSRTFVGLFLAGAGVGAVLHARGEFGTTWLVLGLVGAAGYLLGLNLWHYRHPGNCTEERVGQAWRGASASTLLAAASWVALLFTSCLVVTAANFVNGSEHGLADLGSDSAGPVVVPQVLVWLPIGQLVWVLVVGLAMVVAVVLYWRTAGRKIHDWSAPEEQALAERDRPGCAARRRTAGLVHRAERLLDIIGIVTPPIAVAVIVFSMTGEAPWELWSPLRHIATLALVVTYGGAAGLVLLGSRMRRSEGARRTVGVLWDLTTFWPRAAHPLAPPCYAERVVPELITRTRWALEAPGTDRVVLSGHSQGSLIVAAAASRLDDDELGRVRIITYGSQIRALYGRIFPAVVGPEDIGYLPTSCPPTLRDPFPDVADPDASGPGEPAVGSLRQRLDAAGGCWVNLFRRTDPLGWRVFSDRDSGPGRVGAVLGSGTSPGPGPCLESGVDIAVPPVPPPEIGDPGPVVMTHGGYQHSLDYRRKVCAWTDETVVPHPSGTSGLAPLPPG